MVFANLQHHEKTAFFALLDEYFAARPEIFAASGAPIAEAEARQTAINVATRALSSHPEFGGSRTSPGSSEGGSGNTFGRVAAAQAALKGFSPSPSSSPGPPPTAPPRRPGPGDVDNNSTASVSRAFSTLRTSSNPPTPPAASPVPPPASTAFSAKRSTFAPPPVRSASSGEQGGEPAAAPPPARRAAAPPPVAPRRVPTPEPEGEWAEALYDYDSNDPSDVKLTEGQRVLVTDRTSSDDWWTGEVNGKKGLFPASYVKLL